MIGEAMTNGKRSCEACTCPSGVRFVGVTLPSGERFDWLCSVCATPIRRAAFLASLERAS